MERAGDQEVGRVKWILNVMGAEARVRVTCTHSMGTKRAGWTRKSGKLYSDCQHKIQSTSLLQWSPTMYSTNESSAERYALMTARAYTLYRPFSRDWPQQAGKHPMQILLQH